MLEVIKCKIFHVFSIIYSSHRIFLSQMFSVMLRKPVSSVSWSVMSRRSKVCVIHIFSVHFFMLHGFSASYHIAVLSCHNVFNYFSTFHSRSEFFFSSSTALSLWGHHRAVSDWSRSSYPDQFTGMSYSSTLSSTLFSFSQISLLQQYPHLQQYIKPAIEKAVQDLLAPVVERSAKIALTTTEHIIKKVISSIFSIIVVNFFLLSGLLSGSRGSQASHGSNTHGSQPHCWYGHDYMQRAIAALYWIESEECFHGSSWSE